MEDGGIVLVGGDQRLADLTRDGEDLAQASPPATLDVPVQVAVAAVLHHQVRILQVEIEHPHDVRRGQPDRRLGVDLEPFEEFVRAVLRMEDLDCDVDVEVGIESVIDGALAALAQLALDSVAPDLFGQLGAAGHTSTPRIAHPATRRTQRPLRSLVRTPTAQPPSTLEAASAHQAETSGVPRRVWRRAPLRRPEAGPPPPLYTKPCSRLTVL